MSHFVELLPSQSAAINTEPESFFLSRYGKPRVRALAGLTIGNLKGLFLGKDLQKVRHVFSDEEYELKTLQKLTDSSRRTDVWRLTLIVFHG